eukprot:6107141-Amphidinium_carterae.1
MVYFVPKGVHCLPSMEIQLLRRIGFPIDAAIQRSKNDSHFHGCSVSLVDEHDSGYMGSALVGDSCIGDVGSYRTPCVPHPSILSTVSAFVGCDVSAFVSLQSALEDVQQFHMSSALHTPSYPTLPSVEHCLLRTKLLKEEVEELSRAFADHDMVE